MKPVVLRDVLQSAHDAAAIWLDADLLVHRPFLGQLSDDPDTLVATEDVHHVPAPGSAARVQGLGWAEQRRFPWTINTCLVRVTQAHLGLLAAWQDLLLRDDFQAAQRRPILERPLWLQSDQDLLTALLASKFDSVPVQLLRSGRDIVHAMAARLYPPIDRLRHALRGMPGLVHAIGSKPWLAEQRTRWADLSIYVMLARHYADELDEPMSWTNAHSTAGRWLRRAFWQHPVLAGLPLSILARRPSE